MPLVSLEGLSLIILVNVLYYIKDILPFYIRTSKQWQPKTTKTNITILKSTKSVQGIFQSIHGIVGLQIKILNKIPGHLR